MLCCAAEPASQEAVVRAHVAKYFESDCDQKLPMPSDPCQPVPRQQGLGGDGGAGGPWQASSWAAGLQVMGAGARGGVENRLKSACVRTQTAQATQLAV